MGEIAIRTFCEALYCAYAPENAFTVGQDGRIAFSAQVTEDGQTTQHHVTFLKVRGLTRCPEKTVSEPWDRLELSVIEVERESSGWRVWFNPWYLAEIEFHCDQVLLDGAELTGDGRWLQDELPRSAG